MQEKKPRKKRKLGNYPFASVVFSITVALLVLGLFGWMVLHSSRLGNKIQENIETGSPVYTVTVTDTGNARQDFGLLIRDISVERNCAPSTVGAEMSNRLVVSLHCVGAQIGTKLYIDEKLIPAIVANSRLVIAYTPRVELSTGSLHTVHLAG